MPRPPPVTNATRVMPPLCRPARSRGTARGSWGRDRALASGRGPGVGAGPADRVVRAVDPRAEPGRGRLHALLVPGPAGRGRRGLLRSEEHTSELQSHVNLV